MYVSRDKRRTNFRGLTGSQRTPGFWGVTSCPLKYSPLIFEFVIFLVCSSVLNVILG